MSDSDDGDRLDSGEDRRHGERTRSLAPESVALVNAAGGAGATRLTVEVGAMLAREGDRVAAFDAALDTQGMADYVEGRVAPDVTDLLTDEDVTPAAAMVESPVPGGELHLCPARAPFGDVARAKTPEAARRLETALREAGDAFDRVLVDVPPLASNPAVAAVTAADRVAVVAPPGSRGADAVQRTRAALDDVGSSADLVVANRGDPDELSVAATVPEGPTGVGVAPVSVEGEDEFAASIAGLAEELFDCEVEIEFESGGLLERVR
jgi:septum site-determining protein MinD